MSLKGKYEISLWEDSYSIDDFYPIEHKIAIIGSDSMTSEAKATEPNFVSNINGTHTLTFKMYYNYVDTETGEKVDNPFIKLLVNERKVKLHWKNEWYDLIIKNCQESSSGRTVTYTCKDLYLNELSKTGFNLEFDNELENNTGTVQELGEKVLDGTDWQILQAETILQYVEEPVYESCNIIRTFTAANDTKGTTKQFTTNDKILLFYSCVPLYEDEEFIEGNKFCQFLFTEDNEFITDQGKMLVTNTNCYSVNIDSWELVTKDGFEYIDFIKDNNAILELPRQALVSNHFRGKRLVKSQKQTTDPILGRSVYVYDYTPEGEETKTIYGFPTTETKDATMVGNLFVNYENFADTNGWQHTGIWRLYPLYNESTSWLEYSAKSYLNIPKNSIIFNRGLQETFTHFPEGFAAGDRYILRYKIKESNSQGLPGGDYIHRLKLIPKVQEYNYTLSDYTPDGDEYFDFDNSTFKVDGDWIEIEGKCNKSISRRDIITQTTPYHRLGLFLENISSTDNEECWLEKIEFFPLVIGENGERINPGDLSALSLARVVYIYYEPNKSAKDISDIEILHKQETPWEKAIPQYYDNEFEEIRSISGKNSNRFNFLQSIAETFECWCQFIIEHDEQGYIVYDEEEETRLRPRKYVRFVREIGVNTGLSFTYGLDLKSVERTIASDQIITKTIVTNNSNEFGDNGFCSIARSRENYPRVNFILDFDYFISQGLLDGGQLNKDLYLTTSDSIQYYYKLHNYNTSYDNDTEKLTQRNLELTKQLAYQNTYIDAIAALDEEINAEQLHIMALSSTSSMEAAFDYIKEHSDYTQLVDLTINLTRLKNNRVQLGEQLAAINESIELLKTEIEDLEQDQKEIIENIKEVDTQFFNKYSKFIQEGSWISEDYYDDTKYYLDAKNVAYSSSRPQVSYNISIVRLSDIEEYKNRKFNLGDICYIQDTDFFGYKDGDTLTPYKEKVLISEFTEYFDSPEKDSFKVQNYKTQFEDLFQRITATTQALQYSTGEYTRAANIVSTDGTIEPAVIQNSIAANNQLVIESQNESVYQDNTGITLTDSTNPNYKVKIMSRGIFTSTDGGSNWTSAIRGDGVSAESLSAGVINTNKLIISDGNFTAFRWDSTGINAYEQLYTRDGRKNGINLATFVRFDPWGVYGIRNDTTAGKFTPTSEQEIWDNANFGMTWKGFFVKNKYDNYQVEVSSTDDIRLVKDSNEIIKIGKLSDNLYGIRIKDDDNNSVLETGSDGKLWLKNTLTVGNGVSSTVNIGYNPNKVRKDTNFHEVIHAGTEGTDNEFIVYEDGYLKASGGTFTGKIYATGGKIGNLIINEDDGTLDKVSKVDIISDLGYNFSVSETVITPAYITLVANPIGMPDDDHPTIIWYYSNDFINWHQILGTTGNECIVSYDSFSEWQKDNVCHIKVRYITSFGTEYDNFTTLYQVKDGKDGKSNLFVSIDSSAGTFFKRGIISTNLTAYAYYGTEDVSDKVSKWNWKKIKADGTEDKSWYGSATRIVTISSSDVQNQAKFICQIEINI